MPFFIKCSFASWFALLSLSFPCLELNMVILFEWLNYRIEIICKPLSYQALIYSLEFILFWCLSIKCHVISTFFYCCCPRQCQIPRFVNQIFVRFVIQEHTVVRKCNKNSSEIITICHCLCCYVNDQSNRCKNMCI